MKTSTLAGYGLLGAPLAMAALPVYIHAPKLYGDEFGLGLAMTGLILLGARVLDTVQDPWLGRLTDWAQTHDKGWVWLMGCATGMLCVTYVALFNPPLNEPSWLPWWFAVSMVLVYTAHSALNITYLVWGARISDNTHERTSVVAWREGFALFGVILASTLPMVLGLWLETGMVWWVFSLVFSVVLMASCVWTLWRVPKPVVSRAPPRSLWQPLKLMAFRRLAILFLINGFAVAIAATLSLFYMQDVLRLAEYSGVFLGLYFVAGALSLPLWLYLAKRFGKAMTWCMGGAVAVVGFVWATQLGAGDGLAYAAVCFLSGSALGADLALPASIAADLIPNEEQGQAGGYFGIWSLINKAVLALAAGLALPLLAWFDYQPGQSDGLLALAMLYAGVPCLIKLVSMFLLIQWRGSLEVAHGQ